MYFYIAYGLVFESELLFSELLPVEKMIVSEPDVQIRFGAVSSTGLENPHKKGVLYHASPNLFWLSVPNIARFLVSNGKEIIIETAADIDQDSVRLFLLGSCLAALLMQRGYFILHANAIRIQDSVIAVAGNSGAGKSTLAATFFKEGYSVLADDVCVIDQNLEVIPGFPQLKLWLDAKKALLIEGEQYRKVRPTLEKYAIPLGAQFCQERLPLKAVYVLSSDNKKTISHEILSGIQKFQCLRNQLYRSYFLEGLGLKREHDVFMSKLVNKIKVTKISRPDRGYSMKALQDRIKEDMCEERAICV